MSGQDRKQIHQDILRIYHPTQKSPTEYAREQVEHYTATTKLANFGAMGLMIIGFSQMPVCGSLMVDKNPSFIPYFLGSAASLSGLLVGAAVYRDQRRHRDTWQQELSQLEEQVGE
ncbi:hypothetical protein ACFL0V_02270 [Nanoarchaeota archaeon]